MEIEKIISFVKLNKGKEINVESRGGNGKSVRVIIEKMNYEIEENMIVLKDENTDTTLFIPIENIEDILIDKDNSNILIS